MPFARRSIAIILLAAGGASCATPSAPALSASVRVRVAEVVATRVMAGAVTWIHFTVPLTVENHGATDFRSVSCAAAVDVLVNARWTRAWSPVCAAASGDIIPAGATRNLDIAVGAAVSGPGAPTWSGSPGAQYRVSLGVLTDRVDGELPRLTSNSFTIREAP